MENLLLSLPDVFNYLLVSKAIHGSILSTRFSIHHLVMRQVIFSSYLLQLDTSHIFAC